MAWKPGCACNVAVTHDMAGRYVGDDFVDSFIEFFIRERHVFIIYEIPNQLIWEFPVKLFPGNAGAALSANCFGNQQHVRG
jgi:hypothetical protein